MCYNNFLKNVLFNLINDKIDQFDPKKLILKTI